MKNLVIIFLSILLITGADVRPVFIHMFRALSYAAETTASQTPMKQRHVEVEADEADTVEIPEESTPKAIKLPFLESPTASTTEDLSLDQALEQAEQIQIGRASKK